MFWRLMLVLFVIAHFSAPGRKGDKQGMREKPRALLMRPWRMSKVS